MISFFFSFSLSEKIIEFSQLVRVTYANKKKEIEKIEKQEEEKCVET